MPKWCAVPNCRTGSRTEKKCSVFRVPKDAAKLKKWEEAIPGIVKLKQTDIICEKHFDAIDIAREWIMFTPSGQVIAQVPYKHPQLKKLAVPTRFSDPPTGKENCKSLHNYAKQSIHLQNESLSIQNHCAVPLESSDLSVPVIGTSNYVTCVSQTTPRTNIDIVIDSVIEVSSCEHAPAGSFSPEEITHLEHGYAKQDLDPPQENPLSIKSTSTCTGTSFSAMKVSSCEPSVASSFPFQKSAEVTTSLEIIKKEPDGEAITNADYSAYVPESWSYGKMQSEPVYRALFLYTITKITNCVACPVTQKSVTVDADRTLQYFVYGHHIDPQDNKLERVLKTKEMLPDVLDKFRGMNVCSGLGDVNFHHVSRSSAYQDYVDKWRSKGCALLSKEKRCNSCKKLRKRILRGAARLNNRTTIHRIGDISNPVIVRKLSALRAKMKRARREKLRAKDRVEYQVMNLKAQEAEMARMHDTAKIPVNMRK